MLFSGKENIFKCLVVWLKMLFSYKFFTRQFNPQQQTPAIKSHNHQNTTITPLQQQESKSHRNTNKTQEKKIIIRSNWEKKGGRTIGFGFAIGDDELVLRLRSWSARRWSRTAKSKGEVERRSQTDSKSDGEPIVPSLFFLSLSLSLYLSLSLSLCAGASPSPSALSLFSEKWEFEGKIEMKINLHPFKGQLKSISEKCIFYAQPNTRKYGKAFPKMLFTQNKHSLKQKT